MSKIVNNRLNRTIYPHSTAVYGGQRSVEFANIILVDTAEFESIAKAALNNDVLTAIRLVRKRKHKPVYQLHPEETKLTRGYAVPFVPLAGRLICLDHKLHVNEILKTYGYIDCLRNLTKQVKDMQAELKKGSANGGTRANN